MQLGFGRLGFAWLGAAVGAFAVWRWLRRRRADEPAADPADELRAKLEESRALAGERDEFEERETPVDEADPEARRRGVHEQARSRLEGLKRVAGEDEATS
jgi:hypothetical protein